MSKQREVSSVSNNPIEEPLVEINEEVRKRNVQTDEDFVWVDLPEEEWNARICELNTDIQSSEGNYCSNIVQSSIENASSKEDSSDQSECDTNYFLEDEEILEAKYINECTRNKVKPFQAHRLKYPMPYFMKVREHGTSIGNRQNDNKQNEKKINEQKNKLLPKTKLDDLTTETLEMLIKYGYVGQITERVGKGKNSIVFHAHYSKHNCISTPCHIAVKIYKTSKDEKTNQIIYKRVQREFEHLTTLQKSKDLANGSIWALKARNNVILMQFIGTDNIAAPTIEKYTCEHDRAIYNSIICYMDKCYNVGCLVHGNLSAKKILCWYVYSNGVPSIWITGWSHSVKRKHPLALPKLMKDCHFVTEFFKGRGVPVISLIDLFKRITRQETVEDNLLKKYQECDLYDKYDTNPNRKDKSTSISTNKRFK